MTQPATARRKLAVLPPLPPMQCDEGCDLCCSKPFPISETELVDVLAYANEHGIEARSQGALCPFFHDGRCAVYDARPAICELFGHMPNMRTGCERGYSGNVSDPAPYTAAHESLGPRTRFMHEALGRPVFDTMPEWASLLTRVDQLRMLEGLPTFTIATAVRPAEGAAPFVVITSNPKSIQ